MILLLSKITGLIVILLKKEQTKHQKKRMKNILTIIFLQFFMIGASRAQLPQSDFFQAYENEISGFTLNYHSPLPDVNSALLIRARQDYHPIVWESQAIPLGFGQDFASLIWMYGMDSDAKTCNFDLYVDGEKCLRFSNPSSNDKREWSVEGKDGTSLTFHVSLIDKYKDQMGFAVLRLPESYITPGEKLQLKIVAEDAGSDIWYMTFKSGIHEKVEVAQEMVIKKEGSKLFQLARFDFTHFGQQSQGTIKIGDEETKFSLQPGYNSVVVKLPNTDKPKNYTAKIKISGHPISEIKFTMQPVKQWTVYLVQHTHTDIGYTRPQTEILGEHLRYIDYALDFCDQTDANPENAKFRWTCEASWAVREYLESRPQKQIDRFVKRINEGRIEVTGMFFNYSEIVDENGLAMQCKSLKNIKKQGIEISTAMQNDVNGIGWCLADYFQGTGVKYLIMGQHGHRARIPFDKPTAFWWESPSGKRLLAYRGEHYMYGNTLGLTSGNIDFFRKNLANYLLQLENKNYPFSRTALQFSGYITDNSPPSTIASEMVKNWNKQNEWPKLKIATANAFMQYLDENHAEELPVKKVAWPDWWTDGAGSAMLETKAVLNTQADFIANTGLFAMAKILGAELPADLQNDISELQDALLFYDEHTYGAAESISEPLIENSVIQWNEKAAYAWDAVKRSGLLREKAMGFIQPYLQKSPEPSIAIFNTLNWERSGLVTIYIDHEILPRDKAFRIIDEKGKELAVQAMKGRSDGSYWGLWVENIPAMGYKIFRIEVGESPRQESPESTFEAVFENDFYQLKIDKQNAVINSLFDKELDLELMDQNDSIKLGRLIYEELDNRHQMERFTYNKVDTVFVPLEGKRSVLQNITFTGLENGQVWKSLFLHGDLPGCTNNKGIQIEIRLYHKEKLIELHFQMHKADVKTPEALYVSFPFALPEGKIFFEAQGGMVSPGINQLEGTASDWNCVQSFSAVRNRDAQILFCSHDTPLHQFGGINTGHFYYRHQPENQQIYSWVLNNYWTTNFKASQEGEMRWKYSISSSADTSNANASRFGWGKRIPFLSRVLPAGNKKADIFSQSLLQIDHPNILLISARPSLDGKGIILHLRETQGERAEIGLEKITTKNYPSAIEVNVLEEEINKIDGQLILEPFETKFIYLKK
jgi:glycosyl hydrolase family 38